MESAFTFNELHSSSQGRAGEWRRNAEREKHTLTR